MKVDEARKKIKELQEYIRFVDSYKPETFEQEAVYLYVLEESVSKVADQLNEKGYKVGNRKVISKDVSDLIRNKPADKMHELAKTFFNKNKKRSRAGWF